MIKFILPATILLALMISSQALACRPYMYNYSCEVEVVYQGTSYTTSGKFDIKQEVDEVRAKTGTEPLRQKIAQEGAKAAACEALCVSEEACVSGCLAEAEFPILQCEWMNGCANWLGN